MASESIAAAFMPPSPEKVDRGEQIANLTEEVKELFKKEKYNPVKRLMEIANELKEHADGFKEEAPKHFLEVRSLEAKVVIELAQYVAPKLKSIDTTIKADQTIHVHLGLERPMTREALLERGEEIQLALDRAESVPVDRK